ncbi:hypothetical protein CsSME_00017999 [Camellia sinensis var. sinensis]
MVGRNDGVVWSPTEEKGKCNSAGTSNAAATANNSNIKHVLDRLGSDVVDKVIDFVNIEEPNITSLVRRVKSKAKREWRLQDYEYPGLMKRCKQSKDEDDEGRRKTWAGFGMKNRYPI